MDISSVGIVGAGVMGRGVAHSLAETGHDAVLVDNSESVLAAAPSLIEKDARMFRLVARKPWDPAWLDKIELTTDYDRLSDVDVVIENVTEDEATKRSVYQTIDRVCKPECVLGANTSCISITKLASYTNRSDRVVGIHFMNPVPLKSMVEVMRGYHTSDETVSLVARLLAEMKKDHVVVNDLPGFVTNRVMTLAMNEAAYLVLEGVAAPAEIDRLISQSYGHTMGPLATADLIGLDTILYSMRVLHESFGDSKYRPCPLLEKMVDAGLLGRKSGEGFFQYAQ